MVTSPAPRAPSLAVARGGPRGPGRPEDRDGLLGGWRKHDARRWRDRRPDRHAARGPPWVPRGGRRQPRHWAPGIELPGPPRLACPGWPRRGLRVRRRRLVHTVDLRPSWSPPRPGALWGIVPARIRDHPG